MNEDAGTGPGTDSRVERSLGNVFRLVPKEPHEPESDLKAAMQTVLRESAEIVESDQIEALIVVRVHKNGQLSLHYTRNLLPVTWIGVMEVAKQIFVGLMRN